MCMLNTLGEMRASSFIRAAKAGRTFPSAPTEPMAGTIFSARQFADALPRPPAAGHVRVHPLVLIWHDPGLDVEQGISQFKGDRPQRAIADSPRRDGGLHAADRCDHSRGAAREHLGDRTVGVSGAPAPHACRSCRAGTSHSCGTAREWAPNLLQRGSALRGYEGTAVPRRELRRLRVGCAPPARRDGARSRLRPSWGPARRKRLCRRRPCPAPLGCGGRTQPRAPCASGASGACRAGRRSSPPSPGGVRVRRRTAVRVRRRLPGPNRAARSHRAGTLRGGCPHARPTKGRLRRRADA